MKVPNRYFEFEVDGELLQCRLTTDSIKKLEKNVGKKLQEFLDEMGDDVIPAFVRVLWASRQPFVTEKEKFTIADSEAVYDQLIDEGKDVVSISEIMKGILRESGLIPKEIPKEDAGQEDEDEDDLDDEEVDVDPN